MSKYLRFIQIWVNGLQRLEMKESRARLCVLEQAMGRSQRVEKISAGLGQVICKCGCLGGLNAVRVCLY